MQSVLGWNTIYDPLKRRICSPVSRNWNRGVGGRLFCWDTFFAALMLSLGDREKSYLNIKGILDAMTEDGMVPNCSDACFDRSQPSVGSMCVEKIYQRYQDEEFLREVYPLLYRWNTWYYENRMREDGFMSWGSKDKNSGKGTLFGAKCESGMDNSPMFDDAVYDAKSSLLMQADTGLLGLFIKDCKALLHMAEILGAADDIQILHMRKERAEDALMRLWNDEDGFFENLDLVTGKWVKRFTPMNFFALFSDRLTAEQKQRISKEHLLNPAEFWGEYVLPSVHRGDYAFSEQHYWRGRIWAPLNAIVYEALKDAGLYEEAKMLAERSENLFLREWREHRHVHENYGATDGMGCTARQSDAFYHWGALLGYIALDAMDL
jgi:neutral trehalase